MTAPMKYTSLDVRDDPQLRPLAYEYLKQYTGDFEFLRIAKMRWERGEYLHDGVIKGILNCMLADPRVAEMPSPTYRSFEPRNYTSMVDDYDDDFEPEPVYPRRRSRQRLASSIIPVKYTIKFPFITSGNEQAQKLHFVDDKYEANWYRALDEIQVRARLLCGSYFPVSGVLLGLYDAVEIIAAGEREVCARCERFAGRTLMTILTDYESSLTPSTNPPAEYITRNELPNP